MKKFFFALMMILWMVIAAVPVGAASSDVTLGWDKSIDDPYIQSYKVYYYTITGNPASLDAEFYALSYTLAGGSPVVLNPSTSPKAITIPKTNTQITLNGLKDGKYYFAVSAVDTRGLEGPMTPEIFTVLKTLFLPPLNPRVLSITVRP